MGLRPRRPEGSRTGLARWAALVVGLGLAIAATVALIVSEDAQTLRLAVLGALWAFLIAAFVAGARRGGSEPGAEVELRRGYELELAREVAARREYELRVEVQVRREVEGVLRQDIADLRADLGRLRADILERWDGELRVERVTLRAESTRVTGFGATLQALQDDSRPFIAEVQARPEAPATPEPPRDEPRTDDGEAHTIEMVPVPATDPAEPSGSASGRRHRYRDDDDATTDVLSRVLDEAAPQHRRAPRRRRYRDENEPDDVLARVLGGG